MRKLLAICFLSLFLFNMGGYYLVYIGLSYRATVQLTQKIEADQLSADDTYLIKLPVTIPYQLNQEGFVPATGTIEYKGALYQLVKQKLENDTLHVVCVKDPRQQDLATFVAEFSRFSHDLPTDLQKEGRLLLSKLSKDYDQQPFFDIVAARQLFTQSLYAQLSTPLSDREKTVLTPPPDTGT